MEQNLIVVEQIPVISERLQEVKTAIENRVQTALSLVCNEETYKEVKKIRAELNKEYQELENKRKEIKSTVMAPYNAFEAVYKECAGDIYQKADVELRSRIAEVETALKAEKAEALRTYFEKARINKGLTHEFITLDRSGIKVGISDSVTALMKKADEFLVRIEEDLKAINGHPDKDELLAEYRETLSLSTAMTTVTKRHEALEQAKAERIKIEAEQAMKQIPLHKATDDIPDDIPDDVPDEKPKAKRYLILLTETPQRMEKVFTWLRINGFQYRYEEG